MNRVLNFPTEGRGRPPVLFVPGYRMNPSALQAPDPGRPSVREGVVVVVWRGGRLLLIRRAQGVVAPGAWCFVGGALEPGETQPEAVRREFREEVGGSVEPIRKVWEYTREDGRLRLHWWLAELRADPLVSNPHEVSEIRWCTPAEAITLPGLLDSNRAFLTTVPLESLGFSLSEAAE